MRRKRLLIAVAAILVFLLGVYLFIDAQLRPLVISMAEAQVRALTVQVMHDAILECLDGSITYDELVHVSYDDENRISMLQANVVVMNRLAARTAQRTQHALAAIDSQGVAIPLGNVIGGQMLSGAGPLIHVRIIPVGSVVGEFTSSLQSAGINQTRHLIQLQLKATVNVVLPTGGRPIEVVTDAPVAESVIVGQVPNSFMEFQNTNPGVLNLLPRSY